MGLKLQNNLVIVTSVDDFPTPSGGIITLHDNCDYRINGTVSIGTNRIVLGVSNTIYGIDKSNDKLIYTGTSSMISSTNQDITIRFITLAATNAAGSVFALTGTTSNNIQITDNIFGSSGSCGSITGGNFIIIDRNLFSNNTTGITVAGTANYFVYADNEHVVTAGTCLTVTASTFINVYITRCSFAITSPATALDISASSTVTNGVINNNLFSGTGTYLTGVSIYQPYWQINTSINLVNTPNFMPRVITQSWSSVRATNGTRASSGITTSAFASSAAEANDNTTVYTAYTSNTLAGSFAGLETTSFAECRSNYSPMYSCVFKTGSVITNTRLWVGFISATLTNADDQAGSYAALRYSTVAGDTGFVPIVDNGTTNTVGSTIGTVAANTQYKVEIFIDFAKTKTYFRVNAGSWVVVSAVPLSGDELGLCCELVATSASAARVINFSRFDLIHD